MREVSPRVSSSQRLCTFLVPGFTPHEANDSVGKRALSHSERDSGDANLLRLLFFEDAVGTDMTGLILRSGFVLLVGFYSVNCVLRSDIIIIFFT